METTNTTVHPPKQREGTHAPLLLNPNSQDGTEESGHHLVSKNVSAATMDIWVSTIKTYLKNQGSQMRVNEDILKQLMGSGTGSPPNTQAVVSTVPPKRGSGA